MTITNVIYNEDCVTTIKRDIHYDYVITSPPDFDELGWEINKKSSQSDYWYFIDQTLAKLKPNIGIITVLVSDRKWKGSLIDKAHIIQSSLEENFHMILSRKVWIKSYKIGLYKPNITHILTFGNVRNYKKNLPHLPDAFYDEFHAVGKYRDNFSLDVVKQFISVYTNEDETVYDPFIGSGTTAIACLKTGRNYIGSEIDPETYALCMDRIENEQNTTRKMAEETQCPSGSNQTTKLFTEKQIQEIISVGGWE